MADTIFALSSGSPPAAIGVIRVSGPSAGAALQVMIGDLPVPRRMSLRLLRDHQGTPLDQAFVLWLPGPSTASGEDMAELHCHGGRAVIRAIEGALAQLPGLRHATPGEFTRRAFANGRIDLAEAEGLADLLEAETELQRRNALSLAEGALSRRVTTWRDTLLALSAQVEAALDFADEDDVVVLPRSLRSSIETLSWQIGSWLAAPHAELLRHGLRVALAGPPNVGKSTLFNVLVGSDAAITSPIAGTTRDVLTRPVAIAGVPLVFIDMAGLRDEAEDTVEQIGIARARDQLESADIVLWLGPEHEGPSGCWEIDPRCDEPRHLFKATARHRMSALTTAGIPELMDDLARTASERLPKPDEVALNRRQREHLNVASDSLEHAAASGDILLTAEGLRLARVAFDHLLGRAGVDDMLDALFGRFCIGK